MRRHRVRRFAGVGSANGSPAQEADLFRSALVVCTDKKWAVRVVSRGLVARCLVTWCPERWVEFPKSEPNRRPPSDRGGREIRHMELQVQTIPANILVEHLKNEGVASPFAIPHSAFRISNSAPHSALRIPGAARRVFWTAV